MKGHMLKNHSALLKKSKAATHASRAVLERLDDFVSKRIITSLKAECYRKTLSEKNYSPIYIQKVNKELDRLLSDRSTTSDEGSVSVKTVPSYSTGTATNYASVNSLSSVKPLASPSASSQAGASDISTKTTSTTSMQWHSILQTTTKTGNGAKKSGKTKHISWEDQSTSTGNETLKSTDTAPGSFADASTGSRSQDIEKEYTSLDPASTNFVTKRKTPAVVNSSKRLILDLSEMKISAYNKPFNDSETKQLFVEMCFYARLGFTQPPSCLQCTYLESVKETDSPPDCPRWTIWRRDANQLLHPCYMEDNIVVVQCHAARRLLEGETIEGYNWNPANSLLENMGDDD